MTALDARTSDRGDIPDVGNTGGRRDDREAYEAHVRAVVDQAPPLGPEQRQRLYHLLHGTGGAA